MYQKIFSYKYNWRRHRKLQSSASFVDSLLGVFGFDDAYEEFVTMLLRYLEPKQIQSSKIIQKCS